MVEGENRLEQDVPELEWGIGYDPYHVDVGCVFRRNFLAVC
jgi:hypothetical protein